MLAAGMAADNLAMAVYFGVIMSIHVDRTGFTSTFPGGGGNPSSYYFPSTISLWENLCHFALSCIHSWEHHSLDHIVGLTLVLVLKMTRQLKWRWFRQWKPCQCQWQLQLQHAWLAMGWLLSFPLPLQVSLRKICSLTFNCLKLWTLQMDYLNGVVVPWEKVLVLYKSSVSGAELIMNFVWIVKFRLRLGNDGSGGISNLYSGSICLWQQTEWIHYSHVCRFPVSWGSFYASFFLCSKYYRYITVCVNSWNLGYI